ncbi:adenine phosphoribosyltransferase [Owenweeksia hongkongensis]|uniref:adenine phosphoribosyltransferase n=1 Tax=Owenweeksia hongkongensis TaxID=253245 RepID=UPI003A9518C7
MLEKELRDCIKEIPDFPKPGISFKDITPILSNPVLCRKCVEAMAEWAKGLNPDIIAGVESRGFMFGFALAQKLNIPFVPIRKPGKLPREVFSCSYDLEYGSATLELHKEDIKPGARVIVHDDLLATGGTVSAAIKLIESAGAEVIAAQFLVELSFLNGDTAFAQKLEKHSLVSY